MRGNEVELVKVKSWKKRRGEVVGDLNPRLHFQRRRRLHVCEDGKKQLTCISRTPFSQTCYQVLL